MRLFTALDLPNTLLATIDHLLERLRPTARLKWTPVSSLHITTKFIGEWPEARLEALISALREVPVSGPVDIEVRGLGWFPNPSSARVFWAGIRASPNLEDLARDTEKALAQLGIQPENRKFSPHLTLARIPQPAPALGDLRRAVASIPSEAFGQFRTEQFFLYQSRLSPKGSTYTKLAGFPLERL
jgi:2'-5' RNA ligase